MSELAEKITRTVGISRDTKLSQALRQAAALRALADNLISLLQDLGASVETSPGGSPGAPEVEGCSHPAAFETTTFQSAGRSFACPDCGATWTRPGS